MRLSKKKVLIRKKGDILMDTLERNIGNPRNKILKFDSKLKSTILITFYYLNLLNEYRFSLYCFYHCCKYFIKR